MAPAMLTTTGTASRKAAIREKRHISNVAILTTATVVFLLVGVALHSNLEAKTRNHERGLEIIRGNMSTALHAGGTGFKVMLGKGQAILVEQKAAEARLAAEQAEAAKQAAIEQAAADALYKDTVMGALAEGTKPIEAGTPVSAASPQGGWWPLFVEAGAAYGQDPHELWRVALCESCNGCEQPDPNADNGTCKGMFQFKPSTWLTTPEGAAGVSIWDGAAQIRMAAWMWSQGRRGEWSCQ